MLCSGGRRRACPEGLWTGALSYCGREPDARAGLIFAQLFYITLYMIFDLACFRPGHNKLLCVMMVNKRSHGRSMCL